MNNEYNVNFLKSGPLAFNRLIPASFQLAEALLNPLINAFIPAILPVHLILNRPRHIQEVIISFSVNTRAHTSSGFVCADLRWDKDLDLMIPFVRN